jgi:hypothetical protein
MRAFDRVNTVLPGWDQKVKKDSYYNKKECMNLCRMDVSQ